MVNISLVAVTRITNIVTLRHEGRGFESTRYRSISPVGSPLLAAVPFLEKMYIGNSLIKEEKTKKVNISSCGILNEALS